MVGNGKIAPYHDKVKAIENCPVGMSKKSVLAFLRITGYCRRHIENYSQQAFPLTEQKGTMQPDKSEMNCV